MVNGMVLIGIMLFYLHPQIKTSDIMDISSIINDIASKLSGTNALIQIQVNDKYYTKRVGDINLRTALQVVVMEAENPPATDTQFFRNVPQRGIVYVPQGCLNNYSAWASNTAYRPGYYKWAITNEEYNS